MRFATIILKYQPSISPVQFIPEIGISTIGILVFKPKQMTAFQILIFLSGIIIPFPFEILLIQENFHIL